MRYLTLVLLPLSLPSAEGRAFGAANRQSMKPQPRDDAQIIESSRFDKMRQCELRVDDSMAIFMHVNNDNKIIIDKLVCPKVKGGQHLAAEYVPEILSSDSHEDGLFHVRQHIIQNVNLIDDGDGVCNSAFNHISDLLPNLDAFNRVHPTNEGGRRHWSMTLPDTTGRFRNLNRDLCHYIYKFYDGKKPEPETSLYSTGVWRLIQKSDEVNRRLHCTFTPQKERKAKGTIRLQRATELTIVGDKYDLKINVEFSKDGERAPTDEKKLVEFQENMRKNLEKLDPTRFKLAPSNHLPICLLILGDTNVNMQLEGRRKSGLIELGGIMINAFLAEIALAHGAHVQGYNAM
ncbi:hypothetical protein FOL47_001313 [Perkinsus chesapeaki]|uniref:Uncharacterized protein n=1 Tax=Perkinsus chesapeaki TaxID=330153 RepID=A0A7J6MJT4_PERCH|nr:hypothetical protein FOL47_001313 [Perkinsus chesapeaki]